MNPNSLPEMQELQQSMQYIQQQLQLLLGQKAELEQLTDSLHELEKHPQQKDVLVPFGAGIFLKAEVKDSQTVILNVGANITVEKSIVDALSLVEKQYKELQTIEISMQEELAHIMQQLQFLQLSQAQSEQ